jgi:nucleotide-binding universal stress UspA family protein
MTPADQPETPMYDATLVKAVQAYLRAEEYLDDCHARQGDLGDVQDRLRAAKRDLKRRISDLENTPVEPFRRIVIAISDRMEDFVTIDAAVKLAFGQGASVALLHVIETTNSYVPEAGFPPRSYIEQQYDTSRQLLERARHRIPSGLHVDEIIREGHTPAEIVRYAEEWDADLIVVGTRGGGRLVHFLRGSTAEDVMQRSHCPVMVVDYHARVRCTADAEQEIASPT